MENKILSRSLFGVSVLIFVIAFYFFYGMMKNGAPSSFDPDQMGAELYEAGKADNGNYRALGQEAFDKQVKKINSHIYGGVTFLEILLIIAAGLMVLFLIYGVIVSAMADIKKALPAILFSGLAIITLLLAFVMGGDSSEGLEASMNKIAASDGIDAAKAAVSTTNFWVVGLLIILLPGVALLLIDLVKDIVKGLAK